MYDAFAENFASRNELDAAGCIYRQGEKVVDLWGGGGVGTARSIAMAYSAFATGGAARLFRPVPAQ